jgi:hypothetical protein
MWDRRLTIKVSDPLDRVVDLRLREALLQIRESFGQSFTSAELRSRIPGFKTQVGIYKPAGSPHALWVRQTLKGPYSDEDLYWHPDGSWTYRYSPEEREGKSIEELHTNRGLLQCQADKTPVGVFRQVSDPTGNSTYKVMGLAYVEGFDGTHFVLRGEALDWTALPVPEQVTPVFQRFEVESPSLVESLRIQRDRRFTTVIRELYRGKCSLCTLGYRVRGRSVGLEAAHIIPIKDRGTIADVRNGLLLCQNHHALFDEFGWTPDEDLRVRIADDPEFRSSAAANHVLDWEGKTLANLPRRSEDFPAQEALKWRLAEFDRAWA